MQIGGGRSSDERGVEEEEEEEKEEAGSGKVELSLGGGDGNGAATVGARSEPKEPRSAGDGNLSTVVRSGSEWRRTEISPETIKIGRKSVGIGKWLDRKREKKATPS